MPYNHGVTTTEIPTSIVPPANTTAGLPVVFGTSPVNLSNSVDAPVNKPVLCYTYKEAVEAMGYSDDFSNYTLSEFINSHFSLFAQAPVVLVNVLDPSSHTTSETGITLNVQEDEAVIEQEGVLLESLVLKNNDGSTTYTEEEYEVEFDDDGFVHVLFNTSITGDVQADYDKLDPSAVTSEDIIGGVGVDGSYTGLELVNEVFPRFRLVPGQLLAPGFSGDSGVAAVMSAKASNINGLFKAIALNDIPTTDVRTYTEVAQYKNENNLTSTHQYLCWPKGSLSGKQYHLSTQFAGAICRTDSENEDIPYVSPSNKSLQIDSTVLEDGKEIFLGRDQANYMNGEGVATALNFIGGWKAWGNRTATYPAVTDPKDSFLPVRRMMNYISNNLILTYWQKVDDPTNTRLIETVIDSINIWLNGLAARGFILGGRVEFIQAENPTTDLIDGKVTFHVYVTPPTPAREINFLVEFDPTYFEGLFA